MQSFLEFLASMVEVLGLLLRSVVSLVTMIPEIMESIYSSFIYVPSFIAPFLVLSAVVTLLFAIIRLI